VSKPYDPVSSPDAHDGLLDRHRSLMPSYPLSRFHLSVVGGMDAEPVDANERAHTAALAREDDPARVARENEARDRLEAFERTCSDAGRNTYEVYMLMALNRAIREHGTGFLATSPILLEAVPHFAELEKAIGTPKINQIYGRLYRAINAGFAKMHADLEMRYADARRI
jgi:hypothetical protein